MLPEDIAPLVLKIGGLDTRKHLRHRMNINFYGSQIFVLDAKDLRTLYDIPGSAPGASGLTLAVLGTQEGTLPADAGAYPYYDPTTAPWVPPDSQAIQTYLTSLAGATATYNPIVLPNPDNDFDYLGSNSEYQLDVEMQSVGAPNAKDLDLVLSPASVVFQTGAQYIVNKLSDAVAVSTSLGDCESDEVSGEPATSPTSDAYIMQQAVKQGLAEGQTWFGPSGDEGAADCDDSSDGTKNGYNGGNATVDFPCSLPEVVCVGGTMFQGPGSWDSNGNLTGYASEAVCNEGAARHRRRGRSEHALHEAYLAAGGRARGERRPSRRARLLADGGDLYAGHRRLRLRPGGNAGRLRRRRHGHTRARRRGRHQLLLAARGRNLRPPLGRCRLPAGRRPSRHLRARRSAAERRSCAVPRHHRAATTTSSDTKGKVITGFAAGPGYDLASGWGSLDVAKLIAAWPACGTHGDGGVLPPADAGAGGTDASKSGTDASGSGADSGTKGSPDSGKVRDAGGGAHSSGKTTAGDAGSNASSESAGGCSVASGGSSRSTGWLGGLVALGLVTLRRKRRTA